MAARFLDGLIDFCHRHAWLVLLLNLLAMVAGATYTARNFVIDTDNLRLISSDVPWRKRELQVDKTFPGRADLIIAVIDGATPEIAELASARLNDALQKEPATIQSAHQPDGDRYFRESALLFQSMPDLEANLEGLIKAQPLLGTLARDPSLRGIAGVLELMSQGIEHGGASPEDAAPLAIALTKTLDGVESGRFVPLAWSSLARDRSAAAAELRRLVLIRPVLDYSDLAPGAAAAGRIRAIAAEQGLTPEHGVRLRLTGPVRLSDEEFSTVAEGAELATGLTALIVFIILWIGHKSLRIVAGVYLNLLVGLAVTAAIGLLLVRSYNLISVAFAVLFIGLAVDFGIQFSIRYRTHRFEQGDLRRSLLATGRSVGGSIALAVIATALAFFSLVPTDYRGIAELGLVAGTGMVVALVTTFTLLPALLTILNPPGEESDVGFAFARPLDKLVLRARMPIIAVFGLLIAGAAPLMWNIRFDADPLNLRSDKVESMATLRDIVTAGLVNPSAIDVLTPSIDKATELADRLSALPQVGTALTLQTFVPENQDAKLVLIRDAANLLLPTLSPAETEPKPSDTETIAALQSAAASLKSASKAQPTADARLARLADKLDGLAHAAPERRKAASEALLPGLAVLLDLVRASLSARNVTIADIPATFARDWIARDGRARIEVAPAQEIRSPSDLTLFADAVEQMAPEASSGAITIRESALTVTRAFIMALAIAMVSITALLIAVLRNFGDVLRTLAPLAATAVLTLAVCGFFDLPFNFANIIALPLMFGIGVAFSVYYVKEWRAGHDHLLQTSLTRAVVFSALTTLVAFGGLWLSPHPGTSSMGRLLAIALSLTLLCVLVGLPALLGYATDTRAKADERP